MSPTPTSRPCNLVTGALGFVGTHLVTALVRAGLPVVGAGKHPGGVDPPQRAGRFRLVGPAPELPGAVCYEGPDGRFWYLPLALEEAEPVAGLLRTLDVATVYHLAAQSSAAVSFAEPGETFAANLTGTLNLLEAVRALPEAARPIVLSVGSCEEYGPQDHGGRPLDEDAPLNPISPYAVSKAAQTLLCRQYAHSWELPVIPVRSFSHTGPGHDTRFAFPSFARQIAAAEAGAGPTEIRTGDLSAVRDFLDVRDVIAAYRLLVQHGRPGEVVNVCSGTGLTMARGLEILVGGARCPVTVSADPARSRPSDTPWLVGDNTRLKAATGWEPEHHIEDTLLGLLDEARREFA